MKNNDKKYHLLAGCSFTDPQWQKEIPWSVEYSKTHPSYIVAKAAMGIKGICTEALCYLKKLDNIERVIVILPTLWRYDIEVDRDYYTADALVNLIHSKNGDFTVVEHSNRKWLLSGGPNFKEYKDNHVSLFNSLYKTQGFLVIAKEHFSALESLVNYCKLHDIEIHISSISDLKSGFSGIEYVQQEIYDMLDSLGYQNWIRFDDKFIGEFLGHWKHPDTAEHKILCRHILTQIER
jgi:hypothetical protein